jgi:hypothetical protein
MEKLTINYISPVDYSKKRIEIENELQMVDNELQKKIKWLLEKVESYVFKNTYANLTLSERLHWIGCEGYLNKVQEYVHQYEKLVYDVNLVFADHEMKILSYNLNVSYTTANENQHYLLTFIGCLKLFLERITFLQTLNLNPNFRKCLNDHKSLLTTYEELIDKTYKKR